MLKKIAQCRTLAEYRDRVLEMDQKNVASSANVSAVSIHRIERGMLPGKRRLWKKYMLAYDLMRFPGEFERLSLAGRKEGA